MKYKNAKDVLPPELLCELQKYASGEILYIPKNCEKVSWGQLTGAREKINTRNLSIYLNYTNGVSISELIDEFCLSEDSIRKIIYANKNTCLN